MELVFVVIEAARRQQGMGRLSVADGIDVDAAGHDEAVAQRDIPVQRVRVVVYRQDQRDAAGFLHRKQVILAAGVDRGGAAAVGVLRGMRVYSDQRLHDYEPSRITDFISPTIYLFSRKGKGFFARCGYWKAMDKTAKDFQFRPPKMDKIMIYSDLLP